jgi:hypothetical protein
MFHVLVPNVSVKFLKEHKYVQLSVCVLPTECVHEFRTILTVNSDYFLKQR